MVKQPKEKTPPDDDTEDVIRAVADRLTAARKERGLTQAELGDVAELSQQRIFDLEQGTANVTVRTLVRMAKVLDVDVGSLFSGIATTSEAQLAEAFTAWTAVLKERELQDRERQTQDQHFQERIESILDRTANVIARKAKAEEGSGRRSPTDPGTPGKSR